jgi:hypothetical protein
MGSFSAKLRVWNPNSPERTEEIEAMVDIGAFSWVHRERIERLGAQVLRRMGFQKKLVPTIGLALAARL